MTPTTRQTAELALIRAIPDMFSTKMQQSRERALYGMLQKMVDINLSYLPSLKKRDLEEIESIMDRFGDATGWFNKTKSVETYLSCCACIIENSEFTFYHKIITAINKIIEHIENKKPLYGLSCYGGAVAAEKWEELFKDEKESVLVGLFN